MFRGIDNLDILTRGVLSLSEKRNNLMKFFDNFSVTKYSLSDDEARVLSIKLSKKNINFFNDIVKKASNPNKNIYGGGFISDFDGNNFTKDTLCTIYHDEEKYKANIKLHGNTFNDVTKKRAYSVKIKKEKLFENTRKFSLNVLEEESIAALFGYELSKRYLGFDVKKEIVRVKINGVDNGLYCLIEKMSKELLEKNGYAGFDVLQSKDEWTDQYGGSHGQLFSEELEYTSTKSFSKKDSSAMLLRYEKLYEAKSYDEIKPFFDLDYFARFEAMRILVGDEHMILFDNLRLLYNNSSGLFYPYFRTEGLLGLLTYSNKSFTFDNTLNLIGEPYQNITNILNKNNEFRMLRNKYLYKILMDKEGLLRFYDDNIKKYYHLIENDFSNNYPSRYYTFNIKYKRNTLSRNFEIIYKYLHYSRVYALLKYKGDNRYILEIKPDSNSVLKLKSIALGTNDHDIAVKVTDMLDKETKNLKLSELSQYFSNKNFIMNLDDQLEVEKAVYKYELIFDTAIDIEKIELRFTNDITNQFVKDEDIYTRVVDEPENFSFDYLSIDEFLNNPALPLTLNKKDKTLTLPHGVYKVRTNIVLPYGYNLTIEPGTKIKIAQDKSILVYGGLNIAGTKEKPVIIENLEKNKPFGVVGAIGDNTTNIDINHLNLSGGKEATINGAYLSGGLSLYSHKKVTVKNSHIHHNSADDGLNIKNADVILENNIFNANLADQVDLDVCKGQVTNNKFIENTLTKDYDNIQIPQDDNGDGLDFSGSQIIVKNNYYKGFLDKGISVGENTKALITNNEFQSNRSAITVKDQSDIYLSSNKYNNNKINIEMYQKKQIFNHPSVYNINEKHPKDKIKKAKQSHYYKTNENIKLNDIEQLTIFNDLKMKNWVEYE